MTPGLKTGIERLIHNLAVEHRVSRDRAIFLVECVLGDLKRTPPAPPEPPAGELSERRAA